METSPAELWRFLPLGYLITIAIEIPILLMGLSRGLTLRQKLSAGVWLTACTYPVVILVLPLLLASSSRPVYLVVAEIFAPAAECLLFWLAFRWQIDNRAAMRRNCAAIVVANLASFLLGELIASSGWLAYLR